MAFLVGKVDGNVTADGIQLLTGRHVVFKGHQIPALTEDGLSVIVLCLFDGCRNDFFQEFLWTVLITNDGSYRLDGIAQRIVGVSVAAAGHHKTLSAIVHHLGLTLFHKGFGSSLVTYINILAVLHGKGLNNLVTLGGIDLSIDHEVGTVVTLATGKQPHSNHDAHHGDERQHFRHTCTHKNH